VFSSYDEKIRNLGIFLTGSGQDPFHRSKVSQFTQYKFFALTPKRKKKERKINRGPAVRVPSGNFDHKSETLFQFFITQAIEASRKIFRSLPFQPSMVPPFDSWGTRSKANWGAPSGQEIFCGKG